MRAAREAPGARANRGRHDWTVDAISAYRRPEGEVRLTRSLGRNGASSDATPDHPCPLPHGSRWLWGPVAKCRRFFVTVSNPRL
jgi:hypothetical protein